MVHALCVNIKCVNKNGSNFQSFKYIHTFAMCNELDALFPTNAHRDTFCTSWIHIVTHVGHDYFFAML